MAETKKQSSSERATTPKAGNDTFKTLSAAIGARIKLTTSTSQTYQGTLFTACPTFNVVALNTAPAPPNPSSSAPGDYTIIPLSRVTSVQVLSLAGAGKDGFSAAQPAISKVDTSRLKEREEQRVRKLHAEESKRGKGVTAEGQAIFDALDRMYAVRWHDTEIIVDDSVMVSAPYGAEDCRAPKGKEQSLAYIRRIVEGERKKIASRVASPLPRKGG